MSAIDFSDPVVIAALTDALTAAGVDGLDISGPDQHLRIVVSQQGSGTTIAHRSDANPRQSPVAVIKAPMAGRFQAIKSVEALSLLRPVQPEEVVGFVRIGPVLLPVLAGRSGQLTRQLVEPDELVGFGDSLFEIEAQP